MYSTSRSVVEIPASAIMYTYIYICLFVEREREIERERYNTTTRLHVVAKRPRVRPTGVPTSCLFVGLTRSGSFDIDYLVKTIYGVRCVIKTCEGCMYYLVLFIYCVGCIIKTVIIILWPVKSFEIQAIPLEC